MNLKSADLEASNCVVLSSRSQFPLRGPALTYIILRVYLRVKDEFHTISVNTSPTIGLQFGACFILVIYNLNLTM